MCGASDCRACRPMTWRCDSEVVAETERPWLEASGYDYDDGDGSWSKVVSTRRVKARKAYPHIWQGDLYCLQLVRRVNDATGESHHSRTRRPIVGRPLPAPAPRASSPEGGCGGAGALPGEVTP